MTTRQQFLLQLVHLMMASWAEMCSVQIIRRDEWFWSVNFNTWTKLHRDGEKCECLFRTYISTRCCSIISWPLFSKVSLIKHIIVYCKNSFYNYSAIPFKDFPFHEICSLIYYMHFVFCPVKTGPHHFPRITFVCDSASMMLAAGVMAHVLKTCDAWPTGSSHMLCSSGTHGW
jgi:hypothetical protein